MLLNCPSHYPWVQRMLSSLSSDAAGRGASPDGCGPLGLPGNQLGAGGGAAWFVSLAEGMSSEFLTWLMVGGETVLWC